MRVTGNTMLITGGGSGIGRALAHEFHALGNQVIVSGRNAAALEAVSAAHPGMKFLTVDMTDTAGIRNFAARVIRENPDLNVLVNNAGIMVPEDLLNQSEDLAIANSTIATNLLGPIHLTAALLPEIRKREYGAIVMVSSGLAFIPTARTPTYCATKAAIHSYAQSLRYQLKNTTVEVLELVPPYVQTGLMGEYQANDPNAMPLADFIAETMTILKSQSGMTEVCVERVKPLRFAGERGQEKYEEMFRAFNDRVSSAAHA